MTETKENIYISIEWFHNTFIQSGLEDFKSFLHIFKTMNVSKWSIFSDYCFDDDNKLYDAITFTIIPYVDDFNDLQSFIKSLAPKDLKKTKEVNLEFCEFIKSGYCFNITVIFNKKNKNFIRLTSDNVMGEINSLQNMCESWITNTPNNKDYYENVLKKIKRLKQEAQRPSFNLKLFKRLGLIQLLVAYIMATITKECNYKIDNIGWFSDRDSLTNWMDGLINDLAFACYYGICEKENISEICSASFAVGLDDKNSRKLWYDEINRIPDFLTGALAGRNYETPIPDKYDTIFEQAICNNKNLVIITCFEQEDTIINSGRAIISPKQPL